MTHDLRWLIDVDWNESDDETLLLECDYCCHEDDYVIEHEFQFSVLCNNCTYVIGCE